MVSDKQTITGEYYCAHILPLDTAILKDRRVFPKQEFAVLMQDGATCHTASRLFAQLDNEGVKVWKNWPGNSPDLNP